MREIVYERFFTAGDEVTLQCAEQYEKTIRSKLVNERMSKTERCDDAMSYGLKSKKGRSLPISIELACDSGEQTWISREGK